MHRSPQVPGPDNRQGATLPIVLIALVLFLAMGFAFLGGSRGGYRLTAQAAYRIRLEQVVISALDEARYRLFQQTSLSAALRGQGATVNAEVRARLLEALFQAGGDPKNLDFTLELGDLLAVTRVMARASGFPTDFTKLEARFYGFRPVLYSEDGSFPKPEDYYANTSTFQDDPRRAMPADLQGYCTVNVHVKQGGLQRRVAVTHDVKIVDAAPPAQQFALFSYRSPANLPERMFDALNVGEGTMAIYPQVVGRQFVKGPYALNIEGHTDGKGSRTHGGDRPDFSASYPSMENAWYGWSQVPLQRALRLDFGRFFARGPARPNEICRDRSGFSATLGPGFGPTWTGDRAIFAAEQAYLAASVPVGFQRFFMNGEPHALNGNDERRLSDLGGLGADTWRGLLRSPDPDASEDSVHPYKYSAFVSAQDWAQKGEEGQTLLVEPGDAGVGMWTPIKIYQFKNDGCPRDGILANIGGAVKSLIGVTLDIVGFGFLELRSYKREPVREDMVKSPESSRDMEEMANRPGGPQTPEEDPNIYLMEYGMWWENNETLGALSSFINLGVNLISIATLGAGSAVRAGLVAGKGLMGKAIVGIAQRQVPILVGAGGAGVAGQILTGGGNTNVGSGQVSVGQIVETTDGSLDGMILSSSVATLDPELLNARIAPVSFNAITQRAQHSILQDAVTVGNEVLYQLMSGDPTLVGQVTPADLETWRQVEGAFYPPDDFPNMWHGFLPPGLKPYMRLATAVYPELVDLAGTGDVPVELEGVVAVERYPQAQDNFSQDLTYQGRGILFSSSRGDPDDPNKEPVFGGNIVPAERGRDYLTMVYWSGAAPQDARRNTGLGMLGLTQPRNEGSFVSPYGVRAMGETTAIKGNLVTGFLDRHRFQGKNSLRVFYDWNMLAPEQGNQPAVPADFYLSVAVSPKVAGWYDNIE